MKASVFIGVSVDGFIARPNGDLDFFPGGVGQDLGFRDFFDSVDALVIGRNTYDTVLGYGWIYGKKPVYVLTNREVAAPPPESAIVEFISGEPPELVSRFEERGLRHIYVDGATTIQGFLNAGLIQRLIITRVPVLIGEGIPLFGKLPRDVALRPVRTRQCASGLVQTEYEVVR